jgi:pilus assembly protein CpaB
MHNRQAIIFLALAIILGIGAVMTTQRWVERQTRESAPGVLGMAPVVIARADVPIGTAVKGDQLEIVSWPKKHMPSGAFSSAEILSGRVTRRPLAAGEPVLDSALRPDGSEAGLVGVINADKRAVSVKVDPVIGVAGFVTPGSRVDVLATLRRIDLKQKLPYTKVILQDVHVLAIDQKLEEVENGDPHLVSVVTLEVDPDQAEQLTYTSHEGRLQLALRSPTDHEVVKTRSTGVADLLPPRSPRARRSSRHAVQVIKGSDLSTRRF